MTDKEKIEAIIAEVKERKRRYMETADKFESVGIIHQESRHLACNMDALLRFIMELK